ncbi:unnamed protein product [Arabidopsis thaliana]|uniref:NAC domain-containing protein n=1 Tax=Arabidopsis thaliana TaxID=3702 RepID=A0A5S9S6W1_ARATH|nr:unnamed protein product [Arabidopsis thaliana]
METPVGLRFCPTDEEIVVDYLWPKNSDRDTSHVDRFINTVPVCRLDPWELPCQSRIKLKDVAWCFFRPKENKYGRGDQQMRKTKSGFWKSTGKPKPIMRNRQQIGEKKILMFYTSKESKSDWVIHEYHGFSPNQMMMTYTLCKLMFNGGMREKSSSSPSSSGVSGIEQSRRDSLIPQLVNNSEGSSLHREDPSQFGDVQQEAPIEDAILTEELVKWLMNDEDDAQIEDAIPIEEWKTWLNDIDDAKEKSIMSLHDNRSDYRPPNSLTGVFSDDDSNDDNDSDLLTPKTNSIQTSSTCDSFGSSNHRIDQIKDLQESPTSTINLVSLTQEVSQALITSIDTAEKKKNPYDDAQGTEIGEHKLGQETIKKKRAGFFHRMIQKFVKKIHLCSSISRT